MSNNYDQNNGRGNNNNRTRRTNGADNKTSTTKKKKKSKRRRKKRILKALLFCFLLLIILGLVSIISIGNTMSKINSKDFPKTNSALGIGNLKSEQMDDDVINIAFFGLDRRTPEEPSRSDSMMIVSLDTVHKKVKVSSLMRDTYVNIEGHGYDKLTHAYFYGGPELAVKTINQNFNLNIKNYVAIDFFGLQDLVDAIGGVELDINADEINYMNDYIYDQSNQKGLEPVYLKKGGKQTVTGMQSLAFTRVRYTSSGDFGRTSRQRIVLNAMFDKIKKGGPLKFTSYVKKLLPFVETSLGGSDIFKLGSKAFFSNSLNLEQTRFPIDGHCYDLYVKDIYYLGHDEDATKRDIFNFIYNDVAPGKQLEDVQR